MHLPVTKNLAFRAVILSWFLIMLFSGGISLIFSYITGISVALGGIIWMIPQGYASYQLLNDCRLQPKKLMTKFYQSEVVKLLLVPLLFIGALKIMPVKLAAMASGYFIAQLFFWMIMFYKLSRK